MIWAILLLGGVAGAAIACAAAQFLSIRSLRAEKASLFARATEAEKQVAALQRDLESARRIHETELSALKSAQEERIDSVRRIHEAELSALKSAQEERDRAISERTKELKNEFRSLTEAMLRERSDDLRKANAEQIGGLLNPLKEKMGEFRKAVEDARDRHLQMNEAMKSQVQRMFDMASKLGDDANRLALALKGSGKTQGDWGEMVLETLLKDSGLVRGVHYDVQETLRDSDGNVVRSEGDRMLRPDVVVHYPDGKDVVIDSKVSLSAYTDYVNAISPEAQKTALAGHVKSIQTHVDELAKKNYPAFLPEGRAVDFVVMFMPSEPSYALGMTSAPTLWREAFARRVLIVSPVNLMALLGMIRVMWTRVEQEKNQKAILETAAELMERLHAFYEIYDSVGRKLADATAAYDDSVVRLKGGPRRRSVVNSGRKLEALGVKLSKKRRLPSRFEPDPDDIELFPETPEAAALPEAAADADGNK